MKAKQCTFTDSEDCIHYATPYRVGDFISFTGLWAFFFTSFLICGCCGIPLGRAHHFLHSATDTMKRPSALTHWFAQGKMEHHWFAHRFAPSPVYTLSLHLSIPHSPALDVKVPPVTCCRWQPATICCKLLPFMVSYVLTCSTLTQTSPVHQNKRIGSRWARSYSNWQNYVCISQSIEIALD